MVKINEITVFILEPVEKYWVRFVGQRRIKVQWWVVISSVKPVITIYNNMSSFVANYFPLFRVSISISSSIDGRRIAIVVIGLMSGKIL